MIHTLDASKILQTAQRLHLRMQERFPDRGISALGEELCLAATEAAETALWLKRPIVWFRVLATFVIVLIIAALAAMFYFVNIRLDPKLANFGFADLLQTVESGVNDLIFLSIAVFFLVRQEQRFKRDGALNMLHKLRSMAHIVDMHQLTKDPESVATANPTASSPERSLTAAELNRYFDYCSEMLSLIGKLAALLVQDFDDPVTLSAVTEVENLTTGLSRKIWQKITIISRDAV